MRAFLMILVASVVIGFLLALAHVGGTIYGQRLAEHLTFKQFMESGKTAIMLVMCRGNHRRFCGMRL
jgi:hypothetical protein